jgi:hypothetical protein
MYQDSRIAGSRGTLRMLSFLMEEWAILPGFISISMDKGPTPWTV